MADMFINTSMREICSCSVVKTFQGTEPCDWGWGVKNICDKKLFSTHIFQKVRFFPIVI